MHIPQRYVWIAWAAGLLLVWAVIYLAARRLRTAMKWSSLIALPFGLTEPMFVGLYWTPPSLFDLARRTSFDIESFIFCFAIGGIGAVLFNLLTGRPILIPRRRRDPRAALTPYALALVVAALVFPPMLVFTNRPLLSGITAMIAGAAARLIVLPELWPKTLAGGPLFAVFYAVSLALVNRVAPGYFHAVWRPAGLALGSIAGLPMIELLFAFTFGLMWSGLYEHAAWTLAPAVPDAPISAAIPRPASGDIRTHPPAPATRRR